jgi:tetratricopeptide (TPR) repeat protein
LHKRAEAAAADRDLPGCKNWIRFWLANYRFYETEEECQRVLAEVVEVFRSIGDAFGLSNALGLLGHHKKFFGRLEEAVSLCEESIRIQREAKNPYMLAIGLSRLAETSLALGRYHEALLQSEEAVETFERLGTQRQTARGLLARGQAKAGLSDRDGAIEDIRAATLLFRESNDGYTGAYCSGSLVFLLLEDGLVEEADIVCNDALGSAGSLKIYDDTSALLLAATAGVSLAQNDCESAAWFMGAASKDLKEGWAFFPVFERDMVTDLKSRIEGALGENEYNRLIGKGENAGLEETIHRLSLNPDGKLQSY